MNRTKFLTVAVVGLVLLNLGMAAFVLWGNEPQPPKKENPKAIIIEKLHFDAEQVEAHEKLVKKHRLDIKAKGEQMSAARTALYTLLRSGDLSKRDSLTMAIGQVQQQIEAVHFQHFNDIKNLCKGEQIQAFNALTSDLAMYFSKKLDKPNGRSCDLSP